VATDRWLARPWLSRVVRCLVYGAPFGCSIVGALILSRLIPLAHSWPGAATRLVAIATVSTIVLYGADRLTRRMLPLAALLSLTLVFPDEAPSRFKIAMRSGGTAELRRRLDEYRRMGADEPAIAASRLLELVADLSVHDRLTRGHSERVRAYSQMIGDELGLAADEIDRLRWAALLHDIGKLEIPFEILNKPGDLTAEEFETIKRHPEIGAQLTAPLAGWLGQSIRAVGEHHERWDGNGYPNGLRGTDISLAARIVAVADAFDVMTSLRSYKKPGTAAEARAELARCAGTQFDANVVRAFLSISLGKLRLAMGPLSWITQLTFIPTGLAGATAAAPALMAAAGMTAAALGTAVAPDTAVARPQHQSAAVSVVGFVDARDHSTVTVYVPTETSAPVNKDHRTKPDGPTETNRVTESTSPTAAQPQTPDTGTTPQPGPGQPVGNLPVLETATTSTTPTTAVAPLSPSPTAPPPTVAATTPVPTSSPTTTTITAAPPSPPPTTAPATSAIYLLGSSSAGDVASQAVLPLVDRGPLNVGTVPNLDTDLDDKIGRTLGKDSTFTATSTKKIQRYSLDPAGTLQLNGPTSLLVYAAARDFHGDKLQTQAALVDCVDIVNVCTTFATATVNFTGQNQFTPVTFDFGSQLRTLDSSHNLQLWIIVTKSSQRDMWMAYDTVSYESALTITL
jgi:HD-GYP domain-containing protein (c-di-GMP phosphodiesterase class II)